MRNDLDEPIKGGRSSVKHFCALIKLFLGLGGRRKGRAGLGDSA
jgi:hypothetical protein